MLNLTQIVIMILITIIFSLGSGLTGLSAVNLIAPMLIIFFTFTYYMSLGTSLFIDMINSGVVAYFYSKHKNVNYKIGILMGVISFTFAIIGAIIAFALADQLLLSSFGYFQIIIGCIFIWRGLRWTEPSENRELQKSSLALWFEEVSEKYKKIIIIIASVILGLSGGLFGAGGGFVITFILIFLLAFESHKAVGTACFVMLFTTLGAVFYYSIRGAINFSMGTILGPISIVGAFIGTQAAHKLSEKHLTIILGIIIMLFGFIILFIPK
ncbi:MAG: sulfite exporter TauE/SafE family protein [Promethearchaeota archaeon]